ncbi:SOS response-associated peptidase family protein [Terasakiella sp. A23]|uniref:SOS response-associated peptidase n=1 Tax=Terasakiella sp. FCG-A23 TaxID=3080561 RepID=UPI002952F775|nr:SOS response-associated peptidase family protein [Terasakiella sp. A23]MDV7339255.1 SOS response-associated peptidase family protein [Terasakiella sp. A23]
MCSNFEAAIASRLLQETYAPSVIPKTTTPKTNIRPTDEVLIIKPGNQAELMTWGFQTTWSTQPLINARAETLFEKPTYRTSLENRCLVPASAWFEWRKHHNQKFKNRISIEGQNMFAMAAIWQNDRFCILTQQADAQIEQVHHRMPVIISSDKQEYWLDTSVQTKDILCGDQLTLTARFDLDEERPKHEQFDLF